MANIAASLSTRGFCQAITHVPKTQVILQEMEYYVQPIDFKKTLTIQDRKPLRRQQAWRSSMILYSSLVKDMKPIRKLGRKRADFDDRKIILELLTALNK
jgi:UDP-N-acetylmuramoyl-L-alanyl-D-glutamate--2,6-diaminopimelate ligase